jgi:hypothetical protein
MWELGAGLFHQSDDEMPPGAFSPKHIYSTLFKKPLSVQVVGEFIFARIRLRGHVFLLILCLEKKPLIASVYGTLWMRFSSERETFIRNGR